MTDKVQKIREKVEKRYEYWKEKESKSHSIESEIRMSECQHLLLMLDSLQEEPKFKTGDRIKPVDSCLGSPRTIVDICNNWYITDQGTLDFEYEDNWEAVEEPVSEDLEEASKNYALNNTPWDDCKDEIQESFKAGANWQKIKDESTSKDLGEYLYELSKQFPEVSFAKLSRIGVRVAKWQKQQDSMPVSEDLEKAARSYTNNIDNIGGSAGEQTRNAFKAGTKWQKENFWKPAEGPDLPIFDRGVIVLTQPYPLVNSEYTVSFAHRLNPDGWDGKSITTDKIEHYTPKTYGKGSWNIPDVKYWLDVEFPK